MAPVIRALDARGGVEQRVLLTGQHAEIVHQVMAPFGIRADENLALMKPNQSLHEIGRACLGRLHGALADFRPDVTVVQGDTTTVFFAAVASFFERGQLAHVEAGLRSGDKWAPFPEEMLRRMTDVVADYCFAPTADAAKNLEREGIPSGQVFVTGNTVVDALRAMSVAPPPIEDPGVRRLAASQRRLVLLTAHRRESFGAPLERIFAAVNELAARFPDIRIVYPVHPNPRVRSPARRILADAKGVFLADPISYQDLLALLRRACLVLTDSGGIQEEAPAFGVHALVLRERTERPEGVRAGVATLVGTDSEKIVVEASKHLLGKQAKSIQNPYGDGAAGERVADILVASLTGSPRQTEDWSGP